LESFEGHEGFDEGFALPVLEELEHFFFEFGDAFDVKVDGGEVVFEDSVVSGVWELKFTKVVEVGLSPMSLAVVVVAEAAQEGEESGFGSAEVIDSVGAGAA